MWMCTNSSYSPRHLIWSSALTNRRRSSGVSLLTSLRTYAMVFPHVHGPLRSAERARGQVAQPLPGAEFVDGRPGRLQRGPVRVVVVDHAQPGAVGATHQMQRVAVHGD